MQTIARQMTSDGIKVLMIVDLDPASGAKIEQEAAKNGVIPVDYDRLTPGGGAALYVSFDNVKVGELQGKTLTQCPQVKNAKSVKYVEIDGAPTDNNATLFKQGYDGVLSKTAGWTKVGGADRQLGRPDRGPVFSSMLGKNPDIKAVMVANDTMAGAVITDLKRQSLNGKVAVSGQDASAEGLQHILDGDQCFTIYKAVDAEADPAIKRDRPARQRPGARHQGRDDHGPADQEEGPVHPRHPGRDHDRQRRATRSTTSTPRRSDVCTGAYAAKCTKAGVK